MLLFTHENKRNFVTQFCLRFHLCNHVARLLDQADSIGQKRLYLVLSCCFNNIIYLYMDLTFCLFIIPSISFSVFLSFLLCVFLSYSDGRHRWLPSLGLVARFPRSSVFGRLTPPLHRSTVPPPRPLILTRPPAHGSCAKWLASTPLF